jgi:hypothetical protein
VQDFKKSAAQLAKRVGPKVEAIVGDLASKATDAADKAVGFVRGLLKGSGAGQDEL